MASARPGAGLTVLIYHRIGGGSSDELDLSVDQFRQHLEVLADREVVSLDEGLDRLEAGDHSPAVALTFDDGFAEVHTVALPLLASYGYPMTLYLASGYVGGSMGWDGSTAAGTGQALSLGQLRELLASGLCTIGNHTHSHCRPERLTRREIDDCTAWISEHLGLVPRHFAYPWGVPVRAMEATLRSRFRSCATGYVGRNRPGQSWIRLARVPVRRTDPVGFFRAKLNGRLGPERLYGRLVTTAKGLGIHG